MSSHPPEHLLTNIAMGLAILAICSGAMLTLQAQWRHVGFWQSLWRVGMLSLFFATALVLIDVLIGHSSPSTLF